MRSLFKNNRIAPGTCIQNTFSTEIADSRISILLIHDVHYFLILFMVKVQIYIKNSVKYIGPHSFNKTNS
jgi:hypothetical protein